MYVNTVPIAHPISPIQKTVVISLITSPIYTSMLDIIIKTSHIVMGGAYWRFKCFLMKLITVLRKIINTTKSISIAPTLKVLFTPCSAVHMGNFSHIAHIGSAHETSIPVILKSQNNALRLRSVIIYHPFNLFDLLYHLHMTSIEFFLLRIGNVSENKKFSDLI